MVKDERREQVSILTHPCLQPGCKKRFPTLNARSNHTRRHHPELVKPHGGHNKKPTPTRAAKKKVPFVPAFDSPKENKNEPDPSDPSQQAKFHT